MRIIAAVAILFTILLGSEAAFRGGTISWRRLSGRTVEFTIVSAYTTAARSSPTLFFGEGLLNDAGAFGDETILYNGVDSKGLQYVLQQRVVTHIYATNGPFVAYFEDQARPSFVLNAPSSRYRVATLVNLFEDASPKVAFVPITQMRTQDATASQVLGVNVLDASSFTCSFASAAESLNVSVPFIANNAAAPQLQVSSSCVLSWNTVNAGAVDNQFYAAVIKVAKPSGTYTTVSLEIQFVNQATQSPKCSITPQSRYTIPICANIQASVTATDTDSASLTAQTIKLVSGAVVTPSLSSSLATPITASISYHASSSAIGAYETLFIFTDSNNLIAWCPFTVKVDPIQCNQIVSISESCDDSETPKRFDLTAYASEAQWTTNCPDASITNSESNSTTMLTSPSANRVTCLVSVRASDSCYGVRVCNNLVERGCCPEGYDACGKCGGNNSTCTDCRGVPNGGLVYDDCGICGGDSSTCCTNYLGVPNDLWDYILIPEAVADLIERLESTYAVLEWLHNNLPEIEDMPERVTCQHIGAMAEINRMFLFDCGLEKFCDKSGRFLTALQHATNNYII